MSVLEAKLKALQAELVAFGRVVVAFSGGADSALVAHVATDTLGASNALCATAVSASLAPEELADCRSLASEWGLRWIAVETTELSDAAYAANGTDRCYHCKSNLLEALGPLAASEAATVVLGVNVDDLGDHRPGQSAAAERGAKFPLVTSGFTKADVREVSCRLGLRTWDKPAAACLASRVPYGVPVTLGTLTKVADAESALRELGFRQLRVRHYGELARVELEGSDLSGAVDRRHEVVAAVKGAGYRYVTLDLEGFRSGNLNAALHDRTGSEGPESASQLADVSQLADASGDVIES
ncbi:MAG: ATP-dependent sacrificial sulfur transferase LarE [Acidimicrobiales bacterium]